MDELHTQAEEVARRFVATDRKPPSEGSRLLQDLQQLALAALEIIRSPAPCYSRSGGVSRAIHES
jgi:hypothetical protein